MAVQDIANLIMGPAELYYGIFGSVTEPGSVDVNTTPAATGGWSDMGGTQDGVTWNVQKEWTELEVDQVVDIPGRRNTKRDARITTNLAEGTLDNLKIAENGGTIATGGTFRSFEPVSDSSANQPLYGANIIDGWGPNSRRRRVIARRTLSISNIEMAYKKDGQTLIPVDFALHYVSPSIKSYKVIDSST